VTTGKVVALGLAAGVGLSVLASRSLSGRMQGMGTPDPYLFVSVPAILIVATLLACFLPARSATRIQPVDALRHD
jgi:putative ABC transport system permease protein